MDPDQPVHLCSLIRIHVVPLPTLLQVEKIIANSMDFDQTAQMRRLIWMVANALCWFCCDAAHFIKFTGENRIKMESKGGTFEFDPYTYKGSPNVELSDGYTTVVISFFVFLAINLAAVKIGPPKNFTGDVWRWRNTFVSWLHADIVGVGVLYW
jgi:hypothetical protein